MRFYYWLKPFLQSSSNTSLVSFVNSVACVALQAICDRCTDLMLKEHATSHNLRPKMNLNRN